MINAQVIQADKKMLRELRKPKKSMGTKPAKEAL